MGSGTGTERIEPATFEPLSAVRSDHSCFGCGDLNPIGLRLRFAATEDGVMTRFTPGAEHQGYDLLVHGGIVSAVLDEAMAWAAARAGIWAVTGEMTIRFRRPLHVGEQTNVMAHVTGNHGRLALASAEMRLSGTPTAVATATAKLFRVDPDKEAAWRERYVFPTASTGTDGASA